MTSPRPSSELPSPQKLHVFLRYDEATGHLYWRQVAAQHFGSGAHSSQRRARMWNARNAGRRAFETISRGYYRGRFGEHKILAHRVVWAMVHGAWPENFIDHVSGDTLDNRIENLRDVVKSQNARNQRLADRNNSGALGVSWIVRDQKWRAKMSIFGRTIALGDYDSFEDAVRARKDGEAKYGFHKNHGRASPIENAVGRGA